MNKAAFRQRLRDRIALYPQLWRLYRRLRVHLLAETRHASAIQKVLQAFAAECEAVRFVQVGSNDASFGDPIIDYILGRGWRGVMIEPVPYVFERLQQRYRRNPRLQFENLAIGEFEGERPFYCLEPMERPLSAYYDQMGSFSRAHIEKHERFTPGLSQHIREIQVHCCSLTTLMRKYAFTELDLLHVDAEGADFEVLSSLDFDYCAPGLLLFEHGHLPRAERDECAAFLESRNYRLMYEGRDCLALHASRAERWPQTALVFDAHAPES